MVPEQTMEVHYGRKAFGPQRRKTPQLKALWVAQAIEQREMEHRTWAWKEFGLEDNPAQQALVQMALLGLR